MLNPGLILTVGLALIHAFASQLPVFSMIPRFRWTSFSGGVALSYVFLEVFPELGRAQAELEYSEISGLHYLENHVYILALMGLVLYYGLDLLALRARSAGPTKKSGKSGGSTIFWSHIIVFAILNSISGYLLQYLGEHSVIACIIFFVAIALHMFIVDEKLREHYQALYDKLGRWLLVAAIMLGAIVGQAIDLNEAAIAIVWSFLAGSIILNVLNRELPNETENCFFSFLSGITLFAMLLLLK